MKKTSNFPSTTSLSTNTRFLTVSYSLCGHFLRSFRRALCCNLEQGTNWPHIRVHVGSNREIFRPGPWTRVNMCNMVPLKLPSWCGGSSNKLLPRVLFPHTYETKWEIENSILHTHQITHTRLSGFHFMVTIKVMVVICCKWKLSREKSDVGGW